MQGHMRHVSGRNSNGYEAVNSADIVRKPNLLAAGAVANHDKRLIGKTLDKILVTSRNIKKSIIFEVIKTIFHRIGARIATTAIVPQATNEAVLVQKM